MKSLKQSRLPDVWADRIIIGIRMICIFLFLYTASAKIVDHQRFFNGLHKVQALSIIANEIAWLVPLGEIIVSILLIFPQWAKWGLWGFIFLMITFTGYIICMLIWAKTLPCSCGGAIERLDWGQHVWFNLGFIMLAVFALWLNYYKQKFHHEKS